jgi:hypothetical protein
MILEHRVDVADALAWPAVEWCGRAIADEAAWRAAVDGASAEERHALLHQLGPALLAATPAARERLAAWWHDPDEPDDPVLAEAEARSGLLVYGDMAMLDVIVGAVARLPRAVRNAIITEAAVLAVGRSCAGFACDARLRDRHSEGPAVLVVLSACGSDDEVRRLVLHECAHVWLRALPPPSGAALTVQGEQALYRMASAEGWAQRVHATLDRDELLAQALETLWSA